LEKVAKEEAQERVNEDVKKAPLYEALNAVVPVRKEQGGRTSQTNSHERREEEKHYRSGIKEGRCGGDQPV